MNIPIVSNNFLEEFDTNFDTDMLDLYKLQNTLEIQNVMNKEGNIFRTKKEYEKHELLLPETSEYDNAYENIVSLHSQLRNLTPVEATDPRIWVALENTDFLDYHLRVLKVMGFKAGKQESSIKSRSSFIVNGHKRSLAINNLASLWWIGHVFYDPEHEDPYHFVKLFTQTDFRGNFVALSSSNVIDSDHIRLGIFDAVFELIQDGKISQNRKAFSEANKIMNMIGGIRLLDLLSRKEVYEYVLKSLPTQLESKRR